MFRNTHK